MQNMNAKFDEFEKEREETRKLKNHNNILYENMSFYVCKKEYAKYLCQHWRV